MQQFTYQSCLSGSSQSTWCASATCNSFHKCLDSAYVLARTTSRLVPALFSLFLQAVLTLQRRAYKVKAWEEASDLLEQIARACGRLTKGGEADLNTAAKMMLQDWQRGKLPFYSTPPGYSEAPPAAGEAAVPQDAQAAVVVASGATRACDALHGDQVSSQSIASWYRVAALVRFAKQGCASVWECA